VPESHHRLTKMVNKMYVQVHTSGFLGKVMALLIGATLLAFFFMFSLLVLVPAALIGALVLGYQLRKMKALQKQMREQPSDGQLIEGEIIYDASEAEAIKSVRILNAK
jgi:hypothetical protein